MAPDAALDHQPVVDEVGQFGIAAARGDAHRQAQRRSGCGTTTEKSGYSSVQAEPLSASITKASMSARRPSRNSRGEPVRDESSVHAAQLLAHALLERQVARRAIGPAERTALPDLPELQKSSRRSSRTTRPSSAVEVGRRISATCVQQVGQVGHADRRRRPALRPAAGPSAPTSRRHELELGSRRGPAPAAGRQFDVQPDRVRRAR